nr:cytochrome P450 [Tanacetum cinerariifolium]
MLRFNLKGKENDVASLLNIGDCKINIESPFLMIVVYAPQDQRRKDKLWYDLTTIILDHNSLSIVLGDFNEVRTALKRLGSIFDSRGATRFNGFISNSGLCDLPLGRKRFTRMNRNGSKLSKIYRILVSKHIFDIWPNSHIMALPRELSDHSHLLLTNLCVDFRPSPFKFYNSWILHNDFPSIFLSSWINSRSSVKLKESAPAVSLRDMIDAIDTKAEISPLTTQDIENGTLMVNDLMAFEHRNLKDLRQKSKDLALNGGIGYFLVLTPFMLRFSSTGPQPRNLKFKGVLDKVGGGPLKLSFPRLYRLDTNQQCVVSDRAPTFHQHHARTSDRTATVTLAIDSQLEPSASQVGLYNWKYRNAPLTTQEHSL